MKKIWKLPSVKALDVRETAACTQLVPYLPFQRDPLKPPTVDAVWVSFDSSPTNGAWYYYAGCS